MGSPESSSTAIETAEATSVAVINGAVAEADGGALSQHTLADRIEERAEGVDLPGVSQYLAALRSFHHESIVTPLPEGVGGRFDGSSIEIATDTMEVGSEGVAETIARVQEVQAHELYHAVHHHTEALVTAGEGPSSVFIAGEGFSVTELIEGLTVAKTGDRFVSAQYREYKGRLLSCVGRAGLGLDDVEKAVNRRKDLRSLQPQERPVALAV
ncbi:MAG: hypothetical protein PHI23_04340 [Candidatus Peribacteraceae bacterium]|nr:hypothetical protein [Candidatus Peribacteraceae bacterium]